MNKEACNKASQPGFPYWRDEYATHLFMTSSAVAPMLTACASRESEPSSTLVPPLRLQAPLLHSRVNIPGCRPQQILGHQQTCYVLWHCSLVVVYPTSVVYQGVPCPGRGAGIWVLYLVAVFKWMTATFPLPIPGCRHCLIRDRP